MQFRPQPFWTPRYIRDRLRLACHQRRHPDLPWIPRNATEMLTDLLHTTDRCLEWGSGRSTAWLTARVRSLQSIEDDPAWFEQVRRDLAGKGLDPEAVRLLSAEPEDQPQMSPYVRVVDEFEDGQLNVCVVDGQHRGACALAATAKLAPGGLLIVDDAHWFLDHPTFSPHSRYGKGSVAGDWTSFVNRVAAWRCVWASDGVTDTAFWVKPGAAD